MTAARAFGIEIAATQKDQRRAVGIRVVLDAADEDRMVAAVIFVLAAALEVGHGPRDNRRPAIGARAVDAGEFVAMAAREMLGDMTLIGRENVDDEVRRAPEQRQAGRAQRLAPQNEGRIELNGIE